jgi:hypothetical protein
MMEQRGVILDASTARHDAPILATVLPRAAIRVQSDRLSSWLDHAQRLPSEIACKVAVYRQLCRSQTKHTRPQAI